MALIERDLLGNETDKVKNAVEMLRMFERDDPNQLTMLDELEDL